MKASIKETIIQLCYTDGRPEQWLTVHTEDRRSDFVATPSIEDKAIVLTIHTDFGDSTTEWHLNPMTAGYLGRLLRSLSEGA